MIATIMGNLAVCLGRLGQYDEQIRVGSSAPQPWGAEFGGFIEIQLAYCQALAHAIKGSREKTELVIRKLEERLCGNLPLWVTQAWGLWKADLLLLVGSRDVALETAEGVLRMHGLKLLSPGFAGPYARWLGHLNRAGHMQTEAIVCIEELLKEARQYDVLDRGEILGSSLIVNSLSQHATLRRAELWDILAQLPSATIDQLRRLETLPPN
jgi:hypothetical protein